MYTTDQKNSIIYQAQVKLGEIGYEIAVREDTAKACTELYDQGYHISIGLRVLLNPNLEDQLTAKEIEKLLSCLVDLAEVQDYPAAVPLVPVTRPNILLGQPGPAGPPGQQGVPGTPGSQDIKVISSIPEILIDTYVDGGDGKLTFELVDNTYIAPTVLTQFDGGAIPDPDQNRVVQQGVVIATLPINITITKGRDDVDSASIVPGSLDPAFQSALDLALINSVGSQAFQLLQAAVDSNFSVVVTADDLTTQPSNGDSLQFVFPFLHGNTAGTSPNHYVDLVKLIQTQGDKIINFNGVSQYFWFGYPQSYPALSEIRDQNGFNVTGLFTVLNSVSVTSTGLDVNWTEDYR
ncbi:MAG: hypothetical protein JSW41_04155, partial [Candidatus Aenigmatarchaeota archaeon]